MKIDYIVYLSYMKKFIITEQEKTNILNLYEIIGEKLSPDNLTSGKAQQTKEYTTFLNNYYKINLPSAKTGSWSDKDYNDTFKKFMEEKNIPVYVCKKGDGWCNDNQEGEVGTKDIPALKAAMFPQQQEKINTINDKSYDYKLSNGKYYYSNKGLNKWIEATGKGLESIRKNVKF